MKYLLLLLLLASLARASVTTTTLTCTDGACQLVVTQSVEGLATYAFNWTSGTDGGVTITTGPSMFGQIVRVTTDPGSTAPTDNYDIVMNDDNSFDLLCGTGANRDTANTESVVPFIGNGTTTDAPVWVSGQCTPAITNAGSAKIGSLIIYIHKASRAY